jgi:hypothetical protein
MCFPRNTPSDTSNNTDTTRKKKTYIRQNLIDRPRSPLCRCIRNHTTEDGQDHDHTQLQHGVPCENGPLSCCLNAHFHNPIFWQLPSINKYIFPWCILTMEVVITNKVSFSAVIQVTHRSSSISAKFIVDSCQWDRNKSHEW